MLTRYVVEAVKAAEPKEEVALIFSVRARPQRDEVTKLKVPDRRRFVDAFYDREKEGVLTDLNSLESSGLRVVNRLSGTPDIVAVAKAADWVKMFETNTVFERPEVTIQTNELSATLP